MSSISPLAEIFAYGYPSARARRRDRAEELGGWVLMLGRLAAAAATALLLSAAAAQPTLDDAGFFVGLSDDRPKWIGAAAVEPARDLGARAFRITLQWTPGETRLAEADVAELEQAVSAASGMELVLSVYGNAGSSAPQTDAARDEYCAYVQDALARFPSVRDVVIWNEPNKILFWRPQLAGTGATTAPVAYGALLARCYDVLHSAFANVNVIGLALSPTGNDDAGSHSPGAFVRAVGTAYRASGRTRPLLDTVGHHAYGARDAERPWRKHIASKVISQGDWNKLMYNLWLAFDGTPQAIPGTRGVVIWYMEGGSQTAIDAGKEAAYSGTENVAVVPDDAGGEPDSPPPAETSDAPDQSTQFRDSIRLAACQPYVGAYFNFLLFDESRLAGWQSGAFWADRTAKDSLPAFRGAISEANGATVDCDTLKGGRPSADFMPPSVPANLAGIASPDPLRIELTWSASNDDASSIGYRIYRNGAQVATVSATAWTNTSVAAGTTYTYTVRAIDSAGNLGGASTAVTVTTPVVDTTPPETTITAGPSGTVTETGASFEFVSSESGSRFECSLDGALFVGCSSPTNHIGLALGAHTFSVRAGDVAGNIDPTPATRSWTISAPADTTPPETTIGSGPVGTAASPSASFTFSASEAGARFDCALDAAPFAACSSPHTYSGLTAGEHTFLVRATDTAGNSDPTPATRTWAVLAPAPAPAPSRTPSRRTVRIGTARPDVLRGTPGPDVLRGLAGADLLYGLGGNDVLVGGSGRDRLLGGAGGDVVHARDGARDTISCGAGRDLVYADRTDRVARDCERRRPAVSSRGLLGSGRT
jgi:chitodextrinase